MSSTFRRNKKKISRREYTSTIQNLNREIDIEDIKNDEQEIDILLHDSRLDTLENKVSEIEKTDVDVIELQTRIVRLELIIQALLNL